MEQTLDNLIRKVRRRLVAVFSDPSTSEVLIVKVAKICGIKIPFEVEKKFGSNEP